MVRRHKTSAMGLWQAISLVAAGAGLAVYTDVPRREMHRSITAVLAAIPILFLTLGAMSCVMMWR